MFAGPTTQQRIIHGNAESAMDPGTTSVGEIKDGDLVFRTGPIPNPAKDEVVVKTEWLSLYPTNRIWMSGGTVVKSASDSVAEGAVVMALGTWSDYACVPRRWSPPFRRSRAFRARTCSDSSTSWDRLFWPDRHRRAENRRDPCCFRCRWRRRQHRWPARQSARLQGCGHLRRQGEKCGADPRLWLRPRHRL